MTAKARHSSLQVTLQYNPVYLWITPIIPELTELVRSHEYSFEHLTGRVVRRMACFCFSQQLPHPHITTYRGMLPIVVEWLEQKGIRYTIQPPLPKNLRRPSFDLIEKHSTPCDRGFLEFLRTTPRGIIRDSLDANRVDLGWLMAQVALAWGKASTMATATRIDAVKSLASRIHPYYSRVKAFTVQNYHGSRRLVVTTPGKAHVGLLEIEKRNFLFLLDPLNYFTISAVEHSYEALIQARIARIYGVLPQEYTLNAREQMFLNCFFGPDEYVIPQHGRVLLRVDVAAITMSKGPRIAIIADDMTVRRRGIWHNELRHARLARLALAVARRDKPRMIATFPGLKDVDLALRYRSTVILTDSVEHALAIAKHLPDAKLAFDSCYRGEGLKEIAEGNLYDPTEIALDRGKSDLVIATTAGLAQVPRIGVLIRADSGQTIPPLTISQRSGLYGRQGRILILDCHDNLHPRLREWSRLRRQAYDDIGWSRVGEPPQTPLTKLQSYIQKNCDE